VTLGEPQDTKELVAEAWQRAAAAMLLLRGDAGVQTANQAAEGLFGLDSASLHQTRVERLFEQREPQVAAEERAPLTLQSLLDAGGPFPAHARHSDGARIPVTLWPQALENSSEGSVLLTILDESAAVMADEARRASAERYQELLEHSPAPTAILTLDQRFLYVNPAGEALFERGEDQLLGQRLHTLLDPDDPGPFETIDPALARSSMADVLLHIAGGFGDRRSVRFHLRRYGSADGGEYLLCSGMDVTQQEQASGALETALRRADALLEAMPSVLIGIDRQGTITQWNPAAEALLQLRQDCLGTHLAELPVGWEASKIQALVERCLESREAVRSGDLAYTRCDGQHGLLGLTLTPLCGAAEELEGALVLGSDVTQRRQAEMQADQARKLESIGQLAAGIAHEINTPTQYCMDNVHFLADSFPELCDALEACRKLVLALPPGGPPPPDLLEATAGALEAADLDFQLSEVPSALKQATEGLEQIAQIVRAMKEFSHPGSDEPGPVDVNGCLENTVTVARGEWKNVAQVELDLAPGLPPVQGLPQALNQVFLNLLVNAVHAIADAGREQGLVRIETRESPEGGVQICIQDNGCGIPAEHRERVFDPFFTTKEPGRGTGQGLALAHSVVVQQHAGTIRVESEPGQGTRFEITLPQAAG